MTAARVIAADPAWKFGDQLPGKTRGAARQYSVMTVDEIKAFALPPIADDAYLFLWRVGAMQQEALDVARAWGFTVKAELVWEKVRPCLACNETGRKHRTVEVGKQKLVVELVEPCEECGGRGTKPHFGMGRHVRAAHETCLIATRGRPIRTARNIRSRFTAKMPTRADGTLIHSAKPDEFYDIVRRLAAGPYAELFARRRRPGWIQFGDQLPEKAA